MGLLLYEKDKYLVIIIIISGIFVSFLLKIIQWRGERFYLYFWVFMFLFLVFMVSAVAVLITPLLNVYDPLKNTNLKNLIHGLKQFPGSKGRVFFIQW